MLAAPRVPQLAACRRLLLVMSVAGATPPPLYGLSVVAEQLLTYVDNLWPNVILCLCGACALCFLKVNVESLPGWDFV